jgi:hypothetical protein
MMDGYHPTRIKGRSKYKYIYEIKPDYYFILLWIG